MKKFLFLVAAIAMANVAFAQENTNGDKTEVSSSVQTLETVGSLVQYGYENYSATALVQAVELYSTISTTAGQEGKSTEGGTDSAKDQKFSINVEELLKDAREFADGDEVILAYIGKVEEATKVSATTLGRVGGPSETHECVLAGDTDVYRVRFYGDESASVLVVGDGDTDLDLHVYDENGNLIDSDTDSTDVCVCSWTPRWTGYFSIKIRNYGNVRNYYTMFIE
ncbi:MAG: hypothetical protein IKC12_03610 [Alistipes sp.]|nr:hypothetical protein [Alistipes sp.]